MMAEEREDETEQRLKDSMNGPKTLKPDEQHHYLGTFRERVYLTISVTQAKQHDWSATASKVLAAHKDSQLIINGNLASSLTRPYQLAAIKADAKFIIKTDPFYHTRPTDLAIVIASDHAVYQSPVDVEKVATSLHTASVNRTNDQHQSSGWLHLF